MMQLWNKSLEWLADLTGGPARRRVVVLLAGVLSLQSADTGTVGAIAAQLERQFKIGNTQLGLLVTASTLVGALGALPMGALADRCKRVRVLVITVLLWALAMIASALAPNYLTLLMSRLGLGVVTAAAIPFTASLIGDLFPSRERSRIYGIILTGELAGAGVGLIISADIASVGGWRAPFVMLAVPSVALAFGLRRLLPEPARGGQSWLRPGDEEILSEEDVAEAEGVASGTPAPASQGGTVLVADDVVHRVARARRDVDPRPALVLRENPEKMAWWRAAIYILRVPSNVVLIASSVLGYFFLGGLRSFAVLFIESRYHVSEAAVTLIFIPIGLGALVGTMGGGRIVDRLIRQRKIDARVVVSAIAFGGAALVFAPGFAMPVVYLAVVFYAVGAAFLTAPNPALDAARLDVVPSRLWGRGAAVRTFVQSVLEALAPLAFGYASALLGGPSGASFTSGVNKGGGIVIPLAEGRALEYTFMVMLVPLMGAAVLLWFSRHAYLRDVATADKSEQPAPA